MFLSITSSRTFSPIVELLLMHLLELHNLGTYTQAEPAELFGVGRSTIYRTPSTECGQRRLNPKPLPAPTDQEADTPKTDVAALAGTSSRSADRG
jgi:hypothetical protein